MAPPHSENDGRFLSAKKPSGRHENFWSGDDSVPLRLVGSYKPVVAAMTRLDWSAFRELGSVELRIWSSAAVIAGCSIELLGGRARPRIWEARSVKSTSWKNILDLVMSRLVMLLIGTDPLLTSDAREQDSLLYNVKVC